MFRIRETPKGWIVEIKEKKWYLFGLKTVWKPFVKTSGMDCAWYHSNLDYALINLETEVDKQTEIKKL